MKYFFLLKERLKYYFGLLILIKNSIRYLVLFSVELYLKSISQTYKFNLLMHNNLI